MNTRQRARQRVYAQQADVNAHQPSFRCLLREQPPALRCRGELQPTSVNRAYQIQLDYDGLSMPHVRVHSPQLTRRVAHEPVPHIYGPDEPCLFARGEWRHGTPLTKSIFPWLQLWLFFYESWLVTGVWQGGGIEHGVGSATG